MPLPPSPVLRYLTPDAPAQPPAEFTLVDDRITGGLPYTMPLADGLDLTLFLPSGLAATWTQVDPARLVTASRFETGRYVAGAPVIADAARVPLQLRLRRAGATIAVTPVLAGRRLFLPADGSAAAGLLEPGVVVELIVLGWEVHAGTVRGAGDFGSRVRLAWRPADVATALFSTPPVNPYIIPRLPPAQKMDSETGRRVAKPNRRFRIKHAIYIRDAVSTLERFKELNPR